MAFEGLKEAGAVIGSSKEIGSLFRQGANDARMFLLGQVERIIVNLDSIRDAVDALDPRGERFTGFASVDPNSSETVIEARKGYQHTIESLSIVADGATDVDVFVGSVGDMGFRARYTFAAADMDSDNETTIHVPDGSPVIVRVGAAAARVNIQAKRDKVER